MEKNPQSRASQATNSQILAAVKNLGTQFKGLGTKVQGLSTEVKGLKTEVRYLGVKIGHVEAKVEHLDSKISAVAEQHGSVISRLDTHTEMIGWLVTNMYLVTDHLGIKTEPVPVHQS